MDCLERKNPMDAFYEYLFELYKDEYDYLYPDVYKEMLKDMTEEDAKFMEENEEECMSMIDENLDINFPYDDFLDEEICCDIVIDNGDANTDFDAHAISPYCDSDSYRRRSNLSRESGLALIAKLQDFSIKDFRKIFNACRYADT